MKYLLSVRKRLNNFIVVVFMSAFSSCLVAQAVCPNPGMCFLTQKAKDDWAAEHNCVFGSLNPAKDCSKAWRAQKGFLQKHEGKLVLKGYVPKYKADVVDSKGKKHKKGEVIGKSGVTISTGVDLGQQSNSGTRKIISDYVKMYGNLDNVDIESLIKKIDPFFGLKKEAADDALNASKTGLEISEPEANILEGAFGFYTQTQVAENFDKKNSQGMIFQQLPEEAQTVIVDFAYQYGLSETDGPIRQQFWKYVNAGSWQELAVWLKSNPDQYKGRRLDEGKILQNAIDDGKLPNSGNPCKNSFVLPCVFPRRRQSRLAN